MTFNNQRLHVVDALRGFAIISIMLLHNIEHFDFYYLPQGLPAWMITIDGFIWDSLFFLFGGKSYAIFAFLFGLTFFIQSNNQAQRGHDFRGRFAWRLLLLLLFGLFNSAFYEGDILSIYAMIGIFLIPFAHLKDRSVFIIALVLMLQPYELYELFLALTNPQMEAPQSMANQYFARIGEYIPGDSFRATVKGNLTNGKAAVLYWSWENGRIVQTLSLFMLGMLAGRRKIFVPSDEMLKLWKRVLLLSVVSFAVLYPLQLQSAKMINSEAILKPFVTIITSWSNLSFMFILLAGFVLLFEKSRLHMLLNGFSPLGKMSLSNYIMQSIAGTFIYYGFGLGLYQYTGATWSLLIGIVLAVLQSRFSRWWMRRHRHGPLEYLWHKATWIGSKRQ
jgi:uncharacterized protein